MMLSLAGSMLEYLEDADKIKIELSVEQIDSPTVPDLSRKVMTG